MNMFSHYLHFFNLDLIIFGYLLEQVSHFLSQVLVSKDLIAVFSTPN